MEEEGVPLATILQEETQKSQERKRKRREEEEDISDPAAVCDIFLEVHWETMQKAAKNGRDFVVLKQPQGAKRCKAIKKELEKEGFRVKWDGNFSSIRWNK